MKLSYIILTLMLVKVLNNNQQIKNTAKLNVRCGFIGNVAKK